MSHFYAGDHGWLTMPVPVLRSYLVMLPRLQARGGLDEIGRLAVALGRLPEAEAKGVIRSLREAAGFLERVARPKTRAGYVALLAGAGIGVRRPPDETPSG